MSARPTAADVRLRSISEATWQTTVIRLATLYGWKHFAAPRAGIRANGSVRQTVAGWPDLALSRGERLVFAELKRETGRVSPEQTAWLEALGKVPGVTCFIWRPSDVDDVAKVLGAK